MFSEASTNPVVCLEDGQICLYLGEWGSCHYFLSGEIVLFAPFSAPWYWEEVTE
jgi:hypothetical protein